MRKIFHFVAIVWGCHLIAGQPTAASLKVTCSGLKSTKESFAVSDVASDTWTLGHRPACHVLGAQSSHTHFQYLLI